MKQETTHLSLAGVVPFYVITITILTTIFTFIPHFIIPPALQIPAKALGAFFIFIGHESLHSQGICFGRKIGRAHV